MARIEEAAWLALRHVRAGDGISRESLRSIHDASPARCDAEPSPASSWFRAGSCRSFGSRKTREGFAPCYRARCGQDGARGACGAEPCVCVRRPSTRATLHHRVCMDACLLIC